MAQETNDCLGSLASGCPVKVEGRSYQSPNNETMDPSNKETKTADAIQCVVNSTRERNA
jgi:hypothetical protein